MKKVPPGLEPGLQGSEPWVLTNYTMEPFVDFYILEQTNYMIAKLRYCYLPQ